MPLASTHPAVGPLPATQTPEWAGGASPGAWAWAALTYLLALALPFAPALFGWGYQDGSAALHQYDLLFPRHPGAPPTLNHDWSPGLFQQAWDAWAMGQWRQGEWPLWQPFNGLGSPLWGNGQSGVLNPFKWALVWGASGPAILWFFWCRLAFGGLGTMLLGARLGLGPAPAALAALLWSASAPVLLHFSFPDLHALVCLPWLLCLALPLGAQATGAWAAALGVATGLSAWMGHVEGALFAGLGAGVGWAVAWWQAPRRALGLAWAMAAVAWALLVSAPVWWPLLGVMAESVSYHQDPDAYRLALGHSLPWWAVFKSSAKLALWPFATKHVAWFNPYITSVGLALAIVGLGQRSPLRPLALALLAACGLSVLAFHPTAPHLLLPISPLSYYAYPLASLALALLAGQGLVALGGATRAPGRAWAFGALALLLGALAWRASGQAPLASAALLADPMGPPPPGADAWPLLAHPAWWALAGVAWWPRLRAWLPSALALAAASEAAVWVALAWPNSPVGGYPWPAHWPAPSALVGARLGGTDAHAFAPNLASAYGLRQFDLLEAWLPRRFQAYASLVAPENGNSKLIATAGGAERAGGMWLDLAAVTHRIQPDAQGHWVPVARPHPLPRLRWLDEAEAQAGPLAAELAALEARPSRWRQAVLLALPDGDPLRHWAKALTQHERATLAWEEDAANRLAWQVNSPQPGWLVLADQHAAGWTAEVDGVPVPVVPAYVAMRAVPVPAGAHTVRMRYWPEHLSQALALALLGLLSALAMLAPAAWPWARKAVGR